MFLWNRPGDLWGHLAPTLPHHMPTSPPAEKKNKAGSFRQGRPADWRNAKEKNEFENEGTNKSTGLQRFPLVT